MDVVYMVERDKLLDPVERIAALEEISITMTSRQWKLISAVCNWYQMNFQFISGEIDADINHIQLMIDIATGKKTLKEEQTDADGDQES